MSVIGRSSARTAAIAIAAVVAGLRADAQGRAPSMPKTPRAWLQLRGGIDNAGAAPGSLETHWQFLAPRPVRGLAVADDVIVIGTESADADALPRDFADDQRGFVVAIDASTGRSLWTRSTSSWVHGDPAIYGGLAVVTFGRWPMTHPGGIETFNVATGRQRWSFVADAGMMPAPAIDTSTRSAIIAGGDGVLYAFDLETGRVQRRVGLTSADAMSSPRIDRDRDVFVGAGPTLSRYSGDRLHRLWTFQSRGLDDVGDIPAALADEVVLTTGTERVSIWRAMRVLSVSRFVALVREARRSKAGTSYRNWFRQQSLIALRKRDGQVLWMRKLGIGLEVPRNTSGTPVVTGDRVVVSSPVSKTVWMFSLRSGEPIWNHELSSVHKGAVTVFGADVVAGDKNGSIVFLSAASGKVVGTCSTSSGFSAFAPVVVGRTLIAATRDRWIRAAPYESVRSRAVSSRSCFD